ncbi:phage minor capsid protein [Limosilactobacillus fermentum]|uniref:phage minor capsid protein n=1 Tax=Limosilactobacillus fermentum TaxID=1613 RepID=UPI003EB6A9D7
MGARERFERAANKISDYYQALEQQIFALIVDALQKGDYKHVDQKDVVMWQAQQLQKIGQLNRQVIKLLSKKDGISQQAIEDMVKFHGMAIADEIDSQLERLTNKDIGVSNEINMLVNGIAQQTWTDLQNNVNESLVSRNYGQSAVTKAYRQVLTESTTATVTGLMTHADAVESAMYRVVDKGLPTNLTDKAGRNWSLEGYTRMVVNTTVNRTFSEVRLQRMSDFDMHLALMSSHPNSRPACAPIQGHVVNLVPPESNDYDPKYDSIYNHDYGKPSGVFGINCRHILFPYVPGMSTNHQPQYDPSEAIANGKLVQQQRARERAIRDAKKRLAVAEQLGDEKMISQTKTLLRARQAKLRDFIKETNAGRDIPLLTRDYEREKIVNQA